MRISILGAGAWGTALACALAGRREVTLWARSPQHVQQLCQRHANERYLPGIRLPDSIIVTGELQQAVSFAAGGLLAVATPSAGLRPTLQALRGAADLPPVLWLCKGFERDSWMLPHQIVAEELPARPAGPLSGPSFADEVARGLPTALTVAGHPDFCAQVTRALHGDCLRIYSTQDVIGVEVGGAVKNVMAIGTGIAEALGLGNNARAALITRGLAEATRLGVALGGRASTFTGLTGLGDLILTCTGEQSRNRRVGLALGRGIELQRALDELGHVAEGVWSAPATAARAREAGVDMPITEAVCAVLDGRLSARAALDQLLAREPRNESA
ncbi:MAG TPA: NAD(P)H-dependent glycerol-3-phosphate dehydrogenase [Burkholderiaceae bacterium]|jgi:glycerol-3-phosphate dehydrogenase (NAD(P)+)|nr:NAD(P)H-dependent glycerol-3-phosphate dehydrogenase [Burkholderiaceae bacterium]